ncbi:hypothetical protein CPB86DRAFT_735551 [Serendipita vermifera]|nr:hypothetical protein CPB86DRAFT_735551 [Serendipita vermifera]
MDTSKYIALAGPISYFVAVIVLFNIIIQSLRSKALATRSSMSKLYSALALTSFLHTFSYILLDFEWSYTNYYNSLDYTVIGSSVDLIAHWLQNVSIFEEMWRHGCDGIINWWWIENLCMFTAGTWTVFLVSEGRKRKIPYLWAYAIISQIVAVSTALSLFCLAISFQSMHIKHIPSKKNDDEINAVLPNVEEEAEAPLQLSLPVLLGLFLVSACPAPTSPEFLPFILSLHAVLLIPTLPDALWTNQPGFLRLPVMTVYFAVTALSLVLRIQSTLAAVLSLEYIGIVEFAQAAWQSLHSHPGMATFGWDTIWTTIVFTTWLTVGDGTAKPKMQALLPLLASSATLGVAFSAPLTLGNVIEEVFLSQEAPDKQEVAN